MRFYTHLFSIFFFVLSGSCFADASLPPHQSIAEYTAQKDVDVLLLLMQKRLSVMHEVSRIKWNLQLPIEDRVREGQILNDLCIQCQKYTLDQAFVRNFFQAQMEAAKAIQSSDFALWSSISNVHHEAVLDLKLDIRPYLDGITKELIEAIARIYPIVANGTLSQYLTNDTLSSRYVDQIDENIWKIALSCF